MYTHPSGVTSEFERACFHQYFVTLDSKFSLYNNIAFWFEMYWKTSISPSVSKNCRCHHVGSLVPQFFALRQYPLRKYIRYLLFYQMLLPAIIAQKIFFERWWFLPSKRFRHFALQERQTSHFLFCQYGLFVQVNENPGLFQSISGRWHKSQNFKGLLAIGWDINSRFQNCQILDSWIFAWSMLRNIHWSAACRSLVQQRTTISDVLHYYYRKLVKLLSAHRLFTSKEVIFSRSNL